MIGAKTGDDRVRALLAELGMEFNLTQDGDFIVNIEFDDNRGQGVVISSATHTVDRLEIREVSAVGFETDSAIHADIGNALLIHNAKVALGAWLLHPHQHDDGYTAIFRCPIAATTTAQSLRTIIIEVARAADFIEERFTGQDDF